MVVMSMRETAAAVGLSAEWFRKVWPAMARDHGFPAPFLGRRWDGEAVEAWKRARAQRLAANAGAPIADPASADRARLEALRAG
jgi:hypothetical protein